MSKSQSFEKIIKDVARTSSFEDAEQKYNGLNNYANKVLSGKNEMEPEVKRLVFEHLIKANRILFHKTRHPDRKQLYSSRAAYWNGIRMRESDAIELLQI